MKINRNYFWGENFLNRLSSLGVKYICISPGSRSTSLILAAAANKKFKCFVHIDERSSAFFALGLAKASGTAVVIITTSGTAAAELYPAIIEAYQQRVPLIVCTADRPPELIGRGANQTINQDNLFKNHIRFFENAGLPSASVAGIKKIRKLAETAFVKSAEGPVHLNFPFRKPFEPETITDDLDNDKVKLLKAVISGEKYPPEKKLRVDRHLYKEVLSSVNNCKRGLIIAGPMPFKDSDKKSILLLSERLNMPVIADVCSQLRFGNTSENVITGYEGFLGNKAFIKYRRPDLILQFGRTPSSKAIELFLSRINTCRFIINDYGDIFDPWNTASGILKCPTSLFCRMVLRNTRLKNKDSSNRWLNEIIRLETLAGKANHLTVQTSGFPNECIIVTELLKALPDNTHLMISNSMPLRDFDYFTPGLNKKLVVHFNRGASGIDGIISTSLGIQKALNKLTVLVTGDLAFYYDLNSLLTAQKYRIPLIVILINNNGGGIFGMLPVSAYGSKFREYFIGRHNLDFGALIKGFGMKHKLIKSLKDLRRSLEDAVSEEQFIVLEIKTDIRTSVKLRNNYFNESEKVISRMLNENKLF